MFGKFALYCHFNLFFGQVTTVSMATIITLLQAQRFQSVKLYAKKYDFRVCLLLYDSLIGHLIKTIRDKSYQLDQTLQKMNLYI